MITTSPTTALLQARKQGKAMAIRRRDAKSLLRFATYKRKYITSSVSNYLTSGYIQR